MRRPQQHVSKRAHDVRTVALTLFNRDTVVLLHLHVYSVYGCLYIGIEVQPVCSQDGNEHANSFYVYRASTR